MRKHEPAKICEIPKVTSVFLVPRPLLWDARRKGGMKESAALQIDQDTAAEITKDSKIEEEGGKKQRNWEFYWAISNPRKMCICSPSHSAIRKEFDSEMEFQFQILARHSLASDKK